MPVHEFPIELNPQEPDSDRLHVRIETSEAPPRRLTLFSIQYSAVIGGRTYVIARHDSSHGIAHRRLFDRHGDTRNGRDDPNETFMQVAERARRELRDNWRRLRREFIAREEIDA